MANYGQADWAWRETKSPTGPDEEEKEGEDKDEEETGDGLDELLSFHGTHHGRDFKDGIFL